MATGRCHKSQLLSHFSACLWEGGTRNDPWMFSRALFTLQSGLNLLTNPGTYKRSNLDCSVGDIRTGMGTRIYSGKWPDVVRSFLCNLFDYTIYCPTRQFVGTHFRHVQTLAELNFTFTAVTHTHSCQPHIKPSTLYPTQ